MVRKDATTNKMIIKLGPVEMGFKPFALLVAGIVIIVFILKSGYDINLGKMSCNGKPAEVKVNYDKEAK